MSVGYVLYRENYQSPIQVIKLEGKFSNIDSHLRCMGYVVSFSGVTETYIRILNMDEDEFIQKYGFKCLHVYDFIKEKMIIDDRIPCKKLKDIPRINQINYDVLKLMKSD
jgi:hypothetical protein